MAISVAPTLALAWWAFSTPVPHWVAVVLAGLSLVCTSQLAVTLVNWFATLIVNPRPLPRLDFSEGIPPEQATLVAIPALLTDLRGVDHLVEALEIRYLSNRDTSLFFALLTDFRDAARASLPDDEALVQRASEAMLALNEKYADDRPNIFYLLHRPRKWNERERVWMGYERKRGKLAELNFLLRGGAPDAFSHIAGDLSRLPRISYVIALDADTQLPRDAARRLVGAMAHPLNQPVYDEQRGIVVEGYTILQPRVAVSLASASRSRFVKLFANDVGIDPYTRTVSDVYQDLFHEGSFIGKGIYDVDAFEAAVGRRFPENRILSHDLLEGSYARAGLVSDIQLFEDFPARYNVDSRRRHRWIRGDWQIATWLLPRIPGADVRRVGNPLSALSRWKIFDNLRRSLVPPALISVLLLGWIFFPGSALIWSGFILGVIFLPALIDIGAELVTKAPETPWALHLRRVRDDGGRHLAQGFLSIALLAYDTSVCVDAVFRTIGRLLFTRRRLLEWQSASDAEAQDDGGWRSFLASMWGAPGLALGIAFAFLATASSAWPVALPFLVLWTFAPAIAWWISQPIRDRQPGLSRDQKNDLRLVARRTWSFFETFVGPDDNWLPPDNYQENPAPFLARRTSPTNIGLALLANLAAKDFGFITTDEVRRRVRGTLTTLEGLPRHRGHLFNWYDTSTARPLPPQYLSMVDNGNLAGHLLVLQSGLFELIDASWSLEQAWRGFGDTAEILLSLTGASGEAGALAERVRSDPQDWREAISAFERAGKLAEELHAALSAELSESEAARWCEAVVSEARANVEAIRRRFPWVHVSLPPAGLLAEAADLLGPLWHDITAARDLATLAREGPSWLERLGESMAPGRRATLPPEAERWCVDLRAALEQSLDHAVVAIDELRDLAERAGRQATMDFTLLYNRGRDLFSIGYNLRDAAANYQYRAFGVPGLGFKRGLADDLVIAPYATIMALMVAPRAAYDNLQELRKAGAEGRFGFYEALDFEAARVPRGRTHAIVESFMVHHQGMSLLALAHSLLDRPMQRRFERCRLLKAAELLLHERVPRESTVLFPHAQEAESLPQPPGEPASALRVFTDPDAAGPQTHLLSNGRYHVMVTNAGGGYSRWNQIAVNRWREDATRDCWGTFLYLRDRGKSAAWSVSHQPLLARTDAYEAIFTQGRAEFRVHAHDIVAHTEIAVSPEDDVEVRRVTLTNHLAAARTIELTSYAEIVLNSPSADAAHPAFNNLFVQTRLLPGRHAVLCTRRRRAPGETPPWMFHALLLDGTEVGRVSFETDRARFLGRGRSPRDPVALSSPAPLSDSEGSVLDPIASIRRTVRLEPLGSATFTLVCGVADDQETARGLLDKYHDPAIANRAFELAWTHSLIVLRHINAIEAEAQLYGRLASAVIFAQHAYRASPRVLLRNTRGQRNLWSFGISGDLPIVLATCTGTAEGGFLRHVIQAHGYWRLKGLAVDLVILSEESSTYRESLHDQIMALVGSSNARQMIDKPGGIFARRVDQLSPEDRTLLEASARVVLSDTAGTLEEQLEAATHAEVLEVTPLGTRPRLLPERHREPPPRDLVFFNGLGGFTRDGREYVVILPPGRNTPAPWINVIANDRFGTQVSEIGQGYTWSENCHEFRLTPWENDPVTDRSGEAVYLRDDQTGRVWSPSPAPARGPGTYVTRHGMGYSVYEHFDDGIYSELWICVSVRDPVKIFWLKLHNADTRPRRLSAFAIAELTLSELRTRQAMHIVTEYDPETGAILARNPFNSDFPGRVAFMRATEPLASFTADRAEFLGRNGTPERPAALGNAHLSGHVGPALDPCAALHLQVELAPGEDREIGFVLGAGRDAGEARELIQHYSSTDACRETLHGVWAHWNETLGAVWVEEIINPVLHGNTPEAIARYKVEPYVVAADIYSLAPHTGRGGWTWYTGSAGWMYRLILETLLGITLEEGAYLRICPRLPARWGAYKVHYRFRDTPHQIIISRAGPDWTGRPEITVDGRAESGERLRLRDDRAKHVVKVLIGESS